jgi:hypothetical protein
MGSVLAFATTIMNSLPSLLAVADGIGSAIELVNHGNDMLKKFEEEKRGPTDAEWADLNASIDAKRARLHN